jgi:hypothetical protein
MRKKYVILLVVNFRVQIMRLFKCLLTLPVVLHFGISLNLSVAFPSVAGQRTRFFCGTIQGAPATQALTRRGLITVIRWASDYFSASGFSPERRCELVSARFQQYYQEGTLRYLTTGIMNNQPVICTAQSRSGGCLNILFTLRPGSDPQVALQGLQNISSKSTNTGWLNESSPGGNIAQNNNYVDMEEFLNSAPLENSNSSVTPISPPETNPSESPTNKPNSGSVIPFNW